jgi:hypothetical protein
VKEEKGSQGRVLARVLATELSAEELRLVCGRGTSYVGTGGCDAQGRGKDVEGNDCVEGADTFKCN